MHVAVTGVSGFIGAALARALSAAGHTVAGLVRPTSRRDHIETVVNRFVEGDQADEACWPALLDGADCLIHNSLDWQCLRDGDLDTHYRSNVLGSLRLLEASAPRQFIFVSTIAVHHDMRPRWHGLIDEDHPLRPATRYGACKAAIEAHLWATHFGDGRHTSAFRPCAVYGIDPRLSRSIGFPFVRSLRQGERFDRPGGGKFVHVDDVAAAMTAAVGNPDASGRAFNMADCYARWADLAKMIADHLGIDADIDFSSPTESKNTFTKDAVQSLGVEMNRGHDGLRTYVRQLIEAMDAA